MIKKNQSRKRDIIHQITLYKQIIIINISDDHAMCLIKESFVASRSAHRETSQMEFRLQAILNKIVTSRIYVGNKQKKELLE